MEPVNLFTIPCQHDEGDPPGYGPGYARLAEQLGSVRLGGTVYELPQDQSICPYHYEYGNEEWLLVVAGRPTLRTPAGEARSSPATSSASPKGRKARTRLRTAARSSSES